MSTDVIRSCSPQAPGDLVAEAAEFDAAAGWYVEPTLIEGLAAGGEKESSYGPREPGPAALDIYSSVRTITIAGNG